MEVKQYIPAGVLVILTIIIITLIIVCGAGYCCSTRPFIDYIKYADDVYEIVTNETKAVDENLFEKTITIRFDFGENLGYGEKIIHIFAIVKAVVIKSVSNLANYKAKARIIYNNKAKEIIFKTCVDYLLILERLIYMDIETLVANGYMTIIFTFTNQ